MLENNHEAKCYALQTFLNKMQTIFQKHPNGVTEKVKSLIFRFTWTF